MRQNGQAKLDIKIKSDWLSICFTFVTKSRGLLVAGKTETAAMSSTIYSSDKALKI